VFGGVTINKHPQEEESFLLFFLKRHPVTLSRRKNIHREKEE